MSCNAPLPGRKSVLQRVSIPIGFSNELQLHHRRLMPLHIVVSIPIGFSNELQLGLVGVSLLAQCRFNPYRVFQ